MRGFLKMLPAAMAAAMLMLVVACGGGGSSEKPAADGQTSSQTGADNSGGASNGQTSGGDASGAMVVDMREALGQSATRLAQDVTSVKADFKLDVTSSAFSMGASGDFALESPDQMYMTMKMTGGTGASAAVAQMGDIEILARDGVFYMNSPFTGWISMTMADLGADAETFQKMMSGHSPFDYADMLQKVGGDVTDLGTDQIDGKTYAHVQVTIDMADVVGAFTDALGSTGSSLTAGALPADQMSGPIAMDIWVEPTTMLPRRMSATGSFTTGGQPADMVMEFNFSEYNGAVEIPQAPAEAKSLGDIFSALAAEGSGQ